MIDREEYWEHISHFFEVNEGKKHIFGDEAMYTVYNSFRAILADRVKYGKVEEDKYSEGYVKLTKDNCRLIGYDCNMAIPNPALELRKERGGTSDQGFEDNFCFYVNSNTVSLGTKEKLDGEIVGHLTYDGICAYLGLASNEELLLKRERIAEEIARNAKHEMLQVDEKGENSAQEISDIGNKYLELQCVAREVLTRAQEEVDLNEVNNEDKYAEAAEAYSEAMAKLNKVPLTENEEVQE